MYCGEAGDATRGSFFSYQCSLYPFILCFCIEREWRCTVPSVPEEHLGWRRLVRGLVREDVYAGIPDAAFDFLERCLALDPVERINSRQALMHPFLQSYGHPECCCDSQNNKDG